MKYIAYGNATTVCAIEAESLEDAQRQAATAYEIANASNAWVSGGGDLELVIEVEPEPFAINIRTRLPHMRT